MLNSELFIDDGESPVPAKGLSRGREGVGQAVSIFNRHIAVAIIFIDLPDVGDVGMVLHICQDTGKGDGLVDGDDVSKGGCDGDGDGGRRIRNA